MQKVVLLSQQGSGTNLLRSFLNSHPDIFIDDELFASRKDGTGPYQRVSSVNTEKYFLKSFFKCNNDKKIAGFDLKYNQVNDKILRYLKSKDVTIIHLFRDPARTFIKNATSDIMRKTDLMKYCKAFYKHKYKYSQLFKHPDYLELRYEDMTRGLEIDELPSRFENNLLNWLGVDHNTKLYLTDVGKDLQITY